MPGAAGSSQKSTGGEWARKAKCGCGGSWETVTGWLEARGLSSKCYSPSLMLGQPLASLTDQVSTVHLRVCTPVSVTLSWAVHRWKA